MAQFRPYEPELEKLSSPGSNSPLTPGPRGGTPLSFQTNVNRAKTRRWVEAKKVSYDGDDWGDDEYDEYDVKEQEPAPPSMHLNPRTNTSPAIMDRSRSMDNVATLGPDGWKGARSISADGTTAAELPMANKSPQGSPGSQGSSRVPIVRPANIYQRMRDERAERRQSRTDTSMPGPPNEYFPIVGRSSTDPVSQNLPGDETAAAAGSDHHELHMSREPVAKADNEGSQGSSTSTATQNTPVIKLPEVDRVSGFGTDFLSSSPDNQTSQSPESQKPPLQHNPSLGFRSAVHQAFDVPETPSSAVDSVVRSNSDSTSGVSPIIANRGFNDEKTPTITEEPEAATPPTSERNSIVFKPGHRRDLSLPSPGNSPSRKPIVTSEQTPPSALAQVSSVDPSDIHSSEQIPPNMPTKDIPPLRVSSPVVSGNASSELPVLIPSMSTDNSPQDTESDRLRKEIIRSLSRENTPSDEPEPEGSRPQTRREDSLIPSEYERYWNEEASLSPNDQPRPSIPEYNPQPPSRGLYSSDSHVSSPLATGQDSRPKLKKRFSWESSTSSSDEPTPAAGLDLSQSTTSLGPSPLPDNSTSQLGTETETGDVPKAPTGAEQGEAEKPEKPKLTIIPPSTGDNNSIISGQHLPEVYNGQPVRGPEGGNSPSNIQKAPSPVRALPGPPGETLLGFRDILGIKSSDERVKAFNRTRDQFGKIDTGLNNWIQVTVHDHPEHMDLVEKSQKGGAGGPRLAVTKSKFPKLPSLGNFGTSHQEGSPTGHGHVRRSSAPLGAMMHKQQVEQRGKDLLHTAGVLGGKAGEAAKGFFARGRSKLKAGGNDKVEP